MEKGLKNLNQAYRSAQKKHGGTYPDHEDSGIGISDFDEESSPADMLSADMSEPQFSTYPGGYHSQHQRKPSIQSMIHPQHPQYHQQPSQYMPQQHQHQNPHSHQHQQ
jgi:hypothetical protein